MKSTYIRMWAVIISALGVLACTADEQTLIVSDEDVVRLSADISGVVTRVNYEGTAFTEGDVISVKNLSSEVNNLARYRYNSAYDTWGMLEDGTNVLLWNGTGDNDFAAWYPDHASYDGFEIPSDQTDGYLMADWMTARTVARKSDKILSLSFAHHLSKVEVNVVRWGDMLPEDQVLSGLSVLSLSGKMTNDGQEVTGDNSQMYVAAELSGVASAVAVVAPGTYASGSDFLKVSCVDGGKTLSYAVKLYDDVEMVPGKCYSFDLIVGKLGVSVSNVSVADWDDMELGQVAAEDAYLHVDTPDTQKIGFEGGDIVIPARSNLNFAIECPDWITYQGAVSDGDMENLTFTVDPNVDLEERSGTILLSDEFAGLSHKITVSQDVFTGIDDSSFSTTRYLTYVTNYDVFTQGDAFDMDMYLHRSHFVTDFGSRSKAEYKFMLASAPSSSSEIAIASSRGGERSHDAILLKSSGITFLDYYDKDDYDEQTISFTWDELGVTSTSLITLNVDAANDVLVINGKKINAAIPFAMPSPFLFSSYYRDRDDGEYVNYYGFVPNSRLYYVKAWDPNGRLVYMGGAAMEYNSRTKVREACWKSTYYNNGRIYTDIEFAHYCDNLKDYSPFGSGNMY